MSQSWFWRTVFGRSAMWSRAAVNKTFARKSFYNNMYLEPKLWVWPSWVTLICCHRIFCCIFREHDLGHSDLLFSSGPNLSTWLWLWIWRGSSATRRSSFPGCRPWPTWSTLCWCSTAPRCMGPCRYVSLKPLLTYRDIGCSPGAVQWSCLLLQAYLREQVTGLYNFYRNYTDHSRVPEDHSSQ